MSEAKTVSNWNIPNILTALRVVMVPVFAWVLLAYPQDPTMRWVATGCSSWPSPRTPSTAVSRAPTTW